MISIFALGAALTNVFGRMVRQPASGLGDPRRDGRAVHRRPSRSATGPRRTQRRIHGARLAGGNMEGKEVRFGIVASALFAVVTTGRVMRRRQRHARLVHRAWRHDPADQHSAREVVIGGVGAGLYGMLLFVILSIFVAGLMVGRTPEYVGKKIEAKEVKMAMLAILVLPLMYLGFTAIAVVYPPASPRWPMPGRTASPRCCMPTRRRPAITARPSQAHRQTRSSTTSPARSRCWSPFLDDHSGDGDCRLARRETHRPGFIGTFPTAGGLFVGLTVGVVLIIGGLTFFPALALGPVVEHLAMRANMLF